MRWVISNEMHRIEVQETSGTAWREYLVEALRDMVINEAITFPGHFLKVHGVLDYDEVQTLKEERRNAGS